MQCNFACASMQYFHLIASLFIMYVNHIPYFSPSSTYYLESVGSDFKIITIVNITMVVNAVTAVLYVADWQV